MVNGRASETIKLGGAIPTATGAGVTATARLLDALAESNKS
jgi:hypothetical protein